MINKVWYCDWKRNDYELGRMLNVDEEEVKDGNVSIKEMVDELLGYFDSSVKDDVIVRLNDEWKFFMENNNNNVDSCLFRLWLFIKNCLRRGSKGSNIKKISMVFY